MHLVEKVYLSLYSVLININVDCAKKESKILQPVQVNFPDSKTTPALTVGEIWKTASVGSFENT